MNLFAVEEPLVSQEVNVDDRVRDDLSCASPGDRFRGSRDLQQSRGSWWAGVFLHGGHSVFCMEATQGSQGSQQDPSALVRVAGEASSEPEAPPVVERQPLGSTRNHQPGNQGGQTGHGASVCTAGRAGRASKEGEVSLLTQATGSPTSYLPDSKPSHGHHQAAKRLPKHSSKRLWQPRPSACPKMQLFRSLAAGRA